jgi:hypothetical protein
VHLKGVARLPLLTISAAIDWDLTITIDTSSGRTRYAITGDHDGFPAYEVYINKTPIWRYNPGSPPFGWDHIQRLSPPAEVPVNDSGPLSP